MEQRPSAQSQIKSLILVMTLSVVAAFGILGLFVWYYSPSSNYLVKYVLLSPDIMPEISYNDYNPKTGGKSRFVFDDLIYTYFEKVTNQWHTSAVSLEEYKNIYRQIANLSSLDGDTEQFFGGPEQTILTIKVKTESNAAWQVVDKDFQTVQFSKDDYFRVELHEQNPGKHWAYFYMPGIYAEVNKGFKN